MKFKKNVFVFIVNCLAFFNSSEAQVNPCGKYYCKMYRLNNSVFTYVCDGAVTIYYNTTSQSLMLNDSCCLGGFNNSDILFQNSDSTFNDPWGGGFTHGKLFMNDSISCYQKQGSGPYNYYFGYKIYSLPTNVNSFVKGLKSFFIYPNPVTTILQITDNENIFDNSVYEISNYLGQIVVSQSFENTIDISKLPTGIYTLKIVTLNKENYYSKFIKE